jgi:Uma2 family endonuclease
MPSGETRTFDVDERLVMPETRYEIIDGEVVYVSPADPAHASRHSKLSALLEAYAAQGYDAASDMLTRTSELGDMAPDGSVYPAAPDPRTGRRQLEELAFEIASTERLAHAGKKAARLSERGVRRVFALDVGRQKVLEWSSALGTWQILASDAKIEDRALAIPLPVHDLVAVAKADDAVARALLAKGNTVLAEAVAGAIAIAQASAQARGKALALLAVLRARGLSVESAAERRILETTNEAELDTWLAGATRCASVAALLGGER